MKVAILTQPLGHNYGGLLQAYALQVHLRNQGYEVETIDRRMPKKRWFSIKRYILNSIRFALGKIKTIETTRKRNRVLRELEAFKSDKLVMSRPIYSEKQLERYFLTNNFTAVIVGSDQVWRPKYSPNIYNYYLNFLGSSESPVRKIAYAASFGVDDWEYSKDQTSKCKQLIKKFDGISVRERSGVRLCRQYLDSDVDWVVDPTLLLEPSDYERFLGNEAKSTDNIVLSYVLDPAKSRNSIAQKVSSEIGAEIVSIKPKLNIEMMSARELENYCFPGVTEWLLAFKKARFVVTDSFHGTVFSILFNKPFIAVGNSARGMARFESLLSEFGLLNRLVNSESEVTDELIESHIDWTYVNQVRQQLASAGNAFLQAHLNTL